MLWNKFLPLFKQIVVWTVLMFCFDLANMCTVSYIWTACCQKDSHSSNKIELWSNMIELRDEADMQILVVRPLLALLKCIRCVIECIYLVHACVLFPSRYRQSTVKRRMDFVTIDKLIGKVCGSINIYIYINYYYF